MSSEQIESQGPRPSASASLGRRCCRCSHGRRCRASGVAGSAVTPADSGTGSAASTRLRPRSTRSCPRRRARASSPRPTSSCGPGRRLGGPGGALVRCGSQHGHGSLRDRQQHRDRGRLQRREHRHHGYAHLRPRRDDQSRARRPHPTAPPSRPFESFTRVQHTLERDDPASEHADRARRRRTSEGGTRRRCSCATKWWTRRTAPPASRCCRAGHTGQVFRARSETSPTTPPPTAARRPATTPTTIATAGMLTFAPGNTAKTVLVPTIDDLAGRARGELRRSPCSRANEREHHRRQRGRADRSERGDRPLAAA